MTWHPHNLIWYLSIHFISFQHTYYGMHGNHISLILFKSQGVQINQIHDQNILAWPISGQLMRDTLFRNPLIRLNWSDLFITAAPRRHIGPYRNLEDILLMDIWYADSIHHSILIQESRFFRLFRRQLSFPKRFTKFKQISYRYIYHKAMIKI